MLPLHLRCLLGLLPRASVLEARALFAGVPAVANKDVDGHIVRLVTGGIGERDTAGIIFSIYLMMNGFERFWIEKIRVNAEFDLLGITMTQAELIATLLMISGAALFFFLRKYSKAT